MVRRILSKVLLFSLNQLNRLRWRLHKAFRAKYGVNLAELSKLGFRQAIRAIRIIRTISDSETQDANGRHSCTQEGLPTHLFGHPIVWSEKVEMGDIVLGDLGYYARHPFALVKDDNEIHCVKITEIDVDE